MNDARQFGNRNDETKFSFLVTRCRRAYKLFFRGSASTDGIAADRIPERHLAFRKHGPHQRISQSAVKIEKKPMSKFILFLVMPIIPQAISPSVHAQQPGRIFRIGFLDPSTSAGSAVRMAAFWQELSTLGWVEGKNITVDSQFAEEKSGRLRVLAQELVRHKADVLVGASTAAALAAKSATSAIPIVFTNSADPVGAGLVASLARPGGNVTGLSGLSVELNTKRLEVLADAVPKLARVGLVRPPQQGAISDELQVKELRLAAVALKIELEEIETRLDSKALESAFQPAKQKQLDAIMTVSRPFFAVRKRFVELAAKYRLPSIYPQKEYIDEGGLMYYGADYAHLHRRAAVYVDKY